MTDLTAPTEGAGAARFITPEWIATVEKIRAWIATVPIGVNANGAHYLDFKAYERGERR